MFGRTAQGTRRLLFLGALLTVVGVAVVATAPVGRAEPSTADRARALAGGVALLGGWFVLGYGVHRFGREVDAGPDAENS